MSSSSSNSSLDTTPVSSHHSQQATDFYIIKVTCQTDNVETEGMIFFKQRKLYCTYYIPVVKNNNEIEK